jgi:hypothetical protein
MNHETEVILSLRDLLFVMTGSRVFVEKILVSTNTSSSCSTKCRHLSRYFGGLGKVLTEYW